MLIHKTHSKTDLIDIIIDLDLQIKFSHQDNKKMIQDKIIGYLKNNSKIILYDNFFNIDNADGLVNYLKNPNPKKTLSIKEKNNVMNICKTIISYCKTGYNLDRIRYNTLKELQDDMDFIKQFGDIPSVRRCCKLMNKDIKFRHLTFTPLISPQVQKHLDQKKEACGYELKPILRIKHATPENKIIVQFD